MKKARAQKLVLLSISLMGANKALAHAGEHSVNVWNYFEHIVTGHYSVVVLLTVILLSLVPYVVCHQLFATFQRSKKPYSKASNSAQPLAGKQ